MSRLREKYADGTERQINPFTGEEVWCFPERRHRPNFAAPSKTPRKIHRMQPEDYCDFCPAGYFRTTPEKGRYVLDPHSRSYAYVDRPDPEQVFSHVAEFRRIANLFEIFPVTYWQERYGYRLSPKNRRWKERYLASPLGREHVFAMIAKHLERSGQSGPEGKAISETESQRLADAFFGGGHELIIPRRHFVDGARFDDQLASAGQLSPTEHGHYFLLTLEAMRDIYENNPFVRYISVYQNWLRNAGASFEHLHRQLVAIDRWGKVIEKEVALAAENPNVFNELALNVALEDDVVIAENDGAVAFAALGQAFPTVAIYSVSEHAPPLAHSREEVAAMSDLVHAIHAASGPTMPCNEEWYYQPRDSQVAIPWHILIKWRKNVVAGFESGTRLYVNPLSLEDLRDQIVAALRELRAQGRLGDIRIAGECEIEANDLRYTEGRAEDG